MVVTLFAIGPTSTQRTDGSGNFRLAQPCGWFVVHPLSVSLVKAQESLLEKIPMSDLDEKLTPFIKAALMWFACAIHPISTANSILSEPNEKQKVDIGWIWLSGLLMSWGISITMFHFFKIPWNDAGFFAANAVKATFQIFMVIGVTHYVLKGSGLNSELIQTLVIYICLVAVYRPILDFVNMPLDHLLFSEVKAVAQYHLSFYNSGLLFLYHSIRASVLIPQEGFEGFIFALIGMFSQVLLIIWCALFCEGVVQWYRNDRCKTYLAVAISTVLSSALFIPTGLPFQFYILYSWFFE